jgi:hypothetical protein
MDPSPPGFVIEDGRVLGGEDPEVPVGQDSSSLPQDEERKSTTPTTSDSL